MHLTEVNLASALRSVVASLSQPVQYSDSNGPGIASILRADAAFARKVAADALATLELADEPEIDDSTSECDGCARIIPGTSRDCGCGRFPDAE